MSAEREAKYLLDLIRSNSIRVTQNGDGFTIIYPNGKKLSYQPKSNTQTPITVYRFR